MVAEVKEGVDAAAAATFTVLTASATALTAAADGAEISELWRSGMMAAVLAVVVVDDDVVADIVVVVVVLSCSLYVVGAL